MNNDSVDTFSNEMSARPVESANNEPREKGISN
jgi:hypothetical protein